MKNLPHILLPCAFGLLGLFLLLGDSGYLSYRATLAKYDKLVSEVDHIKQQNLKLMEQVRMLTDDPEFQEYVLRKEMNLIGPNELLLILDRGTENENTLRKD